MEDIRKLIVGNWKMHGLKSALDEVDRLAELCSRGEPKADILICPPATLLSEMAKPCADAGFLVGGQTCHHKLKGAYTGEISAEMLKDAGATHVILGHSERRLYNGETNEQVKAKAEAAIEVGLIPIICIGETRMERDSGQAVAVVSQFLAGSIPDEIEDFVVSYEPLWAIGTGLVPSPGEIAEIHMAIRQRVGGDIPILYGGSVKPDNAERLLSIANVNGALVGGASLKADDFYGIIKAA
ncbi:triose-phosphate isomerase [Parvularcula flava]|uniref:Triosephosphate isomerase n=1 Tax=Aquisalinus luteolus TaxID=1566827 RepID=A0A8J3A1K7_9PROT|nr:triose-phosphate isomerase [Aquisalinus luteolus]NHK27691.1 triose-phosphate isomerase [Aquisalinus luteolus]GGH96206.1 triosephosphate isomerase [Aquisalinus luteolus]